MSQSEIIQLFLRRQKTMPSTISMTGAGLCYGSQVSALCALGSRQFAHYQTVNIASSSVFSYCITQAFLNKAIKRKTFIEFETHFRALHPGNLLHFLRRCLPVLALDASTYDNHLLADICSLLFTDEFLNKHLAELPANTAFWVYCTKKQQLETLTPTNAFGEMTLQQVIRACAGHPKMHGAFAYKNRAFIDVLASPAAKAFIRQIDQTEGNHLIINYLKTRDNNDGKLYLNPALAPQQPKRDFWRLLMGKPNTAMESGQQQALLALQRWSVQLNGQRQRRTMAKPEPA